jgi:glutamate synthase (NADPH/NADH) large chain
LDLSPLLVLAHPVHGSTELHQVRTQDHGLDRALDNRLIELARPALDDALPVAFELPIRNVNRTVGTMLGAEVTRRYGADGLPDGTIKISLTGSAGQSLGAFLPRGIELQLRGDTNDYLGKGLSGGRIAVRPPANASFVAEDSVIAGNVCAYGATSGELFISGIVGERFCVRNSGATAVVEGVGDHALEYMTGGTALILGPTGRNVAAGMSGGVAYLFDPELRLERRLNTEFVEIEPLDEDDVALVAGLLERHVELTGSPLATRLLGDTASTMAGMRKIMPRDYRQVLEATKAALESGQDVDVAVMAVAHG